MNIEKNNSDIICEIEGNAGVITLNRSQALNALSLSMVHQMIDYLTQWKDDPRVCSVILRSSSEKAFCAGGDVRVLYESRNQNDPESWSAAFQAEYLLVFIIHMYPKPYISLIDGLAMGGGLGISVHGSHRLVTERASLAMPEAAIGFFPDVGAGYFLNQCPGKSGTFLGMTGLSIQAEDALYAGLATHFIASDSLDEIYKNLIKAQSVDEINDLLQDAAGGPCEGFLQTHRSLIDRCFSFQTAEEIFDALEQETLEIAHMWLKELLKKSPTSLKVTLALLHYAKKLTLKDVLSLDFSLSQSFLKGHDFFEGVRAVLIDKDQRPVWYPSQLADISQEEIESYFPSKVSLS